MSYLSETQTEPARHPRLRRSKNERWIGGVCAALARRFGLRPGLVRFLFIVSCLLPGPQFLLYIILWVAIPSA